MAEPVDTLDPNSPPGTKKGAKRIWKYEDIEAFQVLDSRFEPPDAVKTPLLYFRTLFTDEMTEHIAQQTNLYSAQELGEPIKTSPEEFVKFLAMLLFMGIFNFLAMEDYWHHKSHISVSCQGKDPSCYTDSFTSVIIIIIIIIIDLIYIAPFRVPKDT